MPPPARSAVLLVICTFSKVATATVGGRFDGSAVIHSAPPWPFWLVLPTRRVAVMFAVAVALEPSMRRPPPPVMPTSAGARVLAVLLLKSLLLIVTPTAR